MATLSFKDFSQGKPVSVVANESSVQKQESESGNSFMKGLSRVADGEKYQRIECGYGYFLKPEGWGRIIRMKDGVDINFDTQSLSVGNVNNPGPTTISSGDMSRFGSSWYSNESIDVTMFNIDNQNLSLALNGNSNIKKGSLDIYRIVESGVENIAEFTPIIIPTFVTLRIEGAANALALSIRNIGEVAMRFKNELHASSEEKGGVITYTDPITNQVKNISPGNF